MNNPMVQLVILAAIAVFLIFRLRSVLGSREGFEPTPQPQNRPASAVIEPAEHAEHGGEDFDITAHAEGEMAKTLAAMKRAEPAFRVSDFLHGAKGAYEMILTAFQTGHLDEVRPFLAPQVAAAFDAIITERQAAGLRNEIQFLGTREVALDKVDFDRATGLAKLGVRFVGEIILATYDQSGAVVEGHPKTARKQRDIWTFERRMGSDDPNWRLVATA